MIKDKLKKLFIFMMAALIGVTSFIGINTANVNADVGEKSRVYAVAYPRSGDTNNGKWGYGQLNLVNGETMHGFEHTILRSMDSYNGNVAYCIEPSTYQEDGDILTEHDENYFNNIPSNGVLSGDDIRLFIGRIMQYGYTGKISTSWRLSDDSAMDKLSQALATQVLIWEVIVGERDQSFNHLSTGSFDPVLNVVQSGHPLRSRVVDHYEKIVKQVQNHTKVPSFMQRASSVAKTYELEWNGSEYTITLTDTNKVLDNYSFKANISGVDFKVSGNDLTISMKEAPDSTLTISAQKKNGTRKGIIVWSDGKYEPGVGIQDVVTYSQNVNDPVNAYLKLKVSYGSLDIHKTSEDGIVSGIRFIIEGQGIKKEVVTKSDGSILVENLKPGKYTISEVAIDRYEMPESQTIEVIAGKSTSITFNNTLKRGDLKVMKTSEDGLIEGMKFHLYGTSLSGEKVDLYATTDKNGIATFEDVLISGTSPYTLEEVDTPNRYVIPSSQDVSIKWNEVTEQSVHNVLKKFKVTLNKSDDETNIAQGDASLSGAIYGVYKDGELLDEYTTDINGSFTTKEYVCNKGYTIKEIKPSDGYLLDETVYNVGAEPGNFTLEHNLIPKGVTEKVIKGKIAIIKHNDDGETQIETPEVGATFEIYLKASGSYENAKESEKDVLVTDENGYAISKDLPYGLYRVHQVSGNEGVELIEDFDVFISKNEEIYRYIINNATFESYIEITKVDSETGKVIPYAGAGFKIYDPSGNLVTMTYTYPEITTIDTFYTDENGRLVTPETLKYGKGYSLVEVKAPYGYVLDPTPLYFDVSEDLSNSQNEISLIKVTMNNTPQKGIIHITKTGEIFSDVVISGDDPKIFQPIYEISGLKDATYEIKAMEDIITPDGTLRYKKDEIVDTIITNEDGIATSKELYLGKYAIQEISAPYGYTLNSEIHKIELSYGGQEVSVIDAYTSYQNERQKALVSLLKTLEISDIYGVGENGEIAKVSFGLYANEDIIANNGKMIPKDALIEIVGVNSDGTATLKTDLPFGEYYLKEYTTDEHYLLNDQKYPFSFEYGGSDQDIIKISVNDGRPIENKLVKGSVEGYKVNEDEKPLKGALFGIFKTDETEFNEEKALAIATSNEEGKFFFEDVVYGEYIIKELKASEGYVMDDTAFVVNVNEDKEVIRFTALNHLIKGNISIKKVDADYQDNQLSGAKFALYKDVNHNKVLDDEDIYLKDFDEVVSGIYELYDLEYGDYLVKETKAPEGFILDEGVYPVSIKESGKTYLVENKAGIGFINEAYKGKLKIVKTSSDDNVEGFTFEIIGPNGYERTFKTDKNGEILIEDLRIGEYTVSEVKDEKSSFYIRPADKKATVMINSTTIVKMHNQVPTIPDTGDKRTRVNYTIPLALGLMGLLSLGAYKYCQKRKKKDQNKNDQ